MSLEKKDNRQLRMICVTVGNLRDCVLFICVHVALCTPSKEAISRRCIYILVTVHVYVMQELILK